MRKPFFFVYTPSMQIILTFLLLISAHAADVVVDVPGDLVDIASTDIGTTQRYKALFFEPLKSEVGTWLMVQKVTQACAGGCPFKTVFSGKVQVEKDPGINRELKTIKGERAIGCCGVRNLHWSGTNLNFEYKVKSTWSCTVKNVDKKNLVPTCRKI